MPSTLVHVALAGLVGTALLGRSFTGRRILVVMAATALVDVDTFFDLVALGTHRSVTHTFLLPLALGALVYWDVRVREASWLRRRWGASAPRVAGTAVAAIALAGIGPDMFYNGVNAFYPLHDEFIELNGKLLVSDQRGIVQTVVEFESEKPRQTSQNTFYRTGVNPTDSDGGGGEENVERIFPLARNGLQLLLVITGAVVVGSRWWETRAETVREQV